MKKTILFFVFIFAASMAYAQCGNGDCGSSGNRNSTSNSSNNSSAVSSVKPKPTVEFRLFPNPATDFIQIDEKSIESGQANYMRIYSLTGQVVKSFALSKGASYSIADLRAGTYLIQFLNYKKKVVSTKRFNKSESF